MSERRFTSGQSVQFEETRWCEFKEVKGSHAVDSIKNTADEYVVAFLNREGGCIYWGIRNIDRIVVGVRLNDEERDQIRRIVTDKLAAIQPAIAPSAFQINLHPINGDKKDVVINAYVIEIIVPAGAREHLYFTGGNESFVKTDAGKRKLSGPQIQDEILRRQQLIKLESTANEVWTQLKGCKIELEPLYDISHRSPLSAEFWIEEVSNAEVRFKKDSNSQTLFLPLFALGLPWKADSYGGLRSTIEKGAVYFDYRREVWRYARVMPAAFKRV